MQSTAGQAHYERAGPGLLAAEPAQLDTPERNAAWWPALYAHSEARLNQMRTVRYSWWWHWSELARLVLPYRYHWVITPNQMNRGNPVNTAIVNSTGTRAMRICAHGMQTGLMSASRPWFRLGLALPSDEPDMDERRWLDDTAERIYAVLAGSNFYNEGAQLFEDETTFGTSPMIIYEDDAEVIRCYVPCAGEYCLGVGARLTVDTLYREYTYTVAQLVEWFGLEACPDELREKWRAGGASLETEYVVAHAIEPNFAIANNSADGGEVSPLSGHFIYREVYWLRGKPGRAPLSIRGFTERPFIAMRWSRTSNDPYGRGPGMDALPDIAQLQHEEVRKAEYIDKFVRPPMVGDVSLKTQPSSIRAGDITFVNAANGKQQFYPAFEVNPTGMAPLIADIERVEKRIEQTFYVDTFLAISQMEGVQPREMLELQLRQGEKIQMLGPVIENAERELSSAIQRVAAIMHRRDMFLPMPKSLRERPLKIEYVSIMKLMQQAAETAGMSATVKFAGEMTEAAQAAGLPPPLRVLDLDGYARRFADRVGNPAKLVFSAKEVAAADAQKAQAAQRQQLMAATLPAVEAAKNLSQTDVGEGQNALAMMLGRGAEARPQ